MGVTKPVATAQSSDEVVSSALLPVALLVRRHELGLSDDMPLHSGFELGLGENFRRKRNIERVELMKIAMASDRRTGTVIGRFPAIVQPGYRAFR